MKRLGLEPVQNDPEWSKLVDSNGTRIHGARKSLINGIWLKWKKPTNSVTELGDLEMQEVERYDAKVGSVSIPRLSKLMWHALLQEDLRLYRTIHARRTEREHRMAARNELIKMSLTERYNQIDGHHLCTPFILTLVVLAFVSIVAMALSGAAVLSSGNAICSSPPAVEGRCAKSSALVSLLVSKCGRSRLPWLCAQTTAGLTRPCLRAFLVAIAVLLAILSHSHPIPCIKQLKNIKLDLYLELRKYFTDFVTVLNEVLRSVLMRAK